MNARVDGGRFDALILAGGRAARLGGRPKPGIVINEATLLARALDAVAGAGRIAVVGPEELRAELDRSRTGRRAALTLEDPPFGGPVAGVAAGLEALSRAEVEQPPWVLVLAVDVPRAASAVPSLLAAVGAGAAVEEDGVYLVRDGRAQWLVGLYRRAALDSALGSLGSARGASVKRLVGSLRCREVDDPAGLSDDVDTWADVRRAQDEATVTAGDVATETTTNRADDGAGARTSAAPHTGNEER